MTPTEEIEAKREADRQETASAWEDLVNNKSFLRIFTHDLQVKFPIFEPCFQGDGNTQIAAQRDGEKKVVCHIWKAIEAARKRITSDKPQQKPTSTIL